DRPERLHARRLGAAPLGGTAGRSVRAVRPGVTRGCSRREQLVVRRRRQVSLGRQIRRYAREMLAASGLVVIGLAVAYVILSQQHYHWPWESFYEVKAEFSSAQAVTPGQGQMVTVSGVKVGDVAGVQLEDGHAVVTLDIDERYAPIYNDAHMLLRPRTGLKDMEAV